MSGPDFLTALRPAAEKLPKDVREALFKVAQAEYWAQVPPGTTETLLLAARSAPEPGEGLRTALERHTPTPANGPFIGCSCDWESTTGEGSEWAAHFLRAAEPANVRTALAYEWSERWLVYTDSGGASAIVARDVPPDWAAYFLRIVALPAERAVSEGLPAEHELAAIIDSLGYEIRRYGRGEADESDDGQSFGIASGLEVAQALRARLTASREPA